MSDKTLLFIHALTGLHPGSGTALGVVDCQCSASATPTGR